MRRHLYPYPGVIDITMANERIDSIRRELRTVQSQVTLAKTDYDALKAALEKAIPAEKSAAGQKAAMVEIRQGLEKENRELEVRQQRAADAEKAQIFQRANADSSKAAGHAAKMRLAVDEQEALVSVMQKQLDSLAAGPEVREDLEAQMAVCAEKF